MDRLFSNGHFYRGNESSFATHMLVQNGVISYIGDSLQDIQNLASEDRLVTQDVGGKYILPSFVDGHLHALLLGQNLRKLNLEKCLNIDDIRSTIKDYAQKNPHLPQLYCGGFMEYMCEGSPDATMLDGIDPRPIFIESRSLHYCWCNAAALKELGVQDTPDPVGGRISRDAQGNPTGLFSEAANVFLIWPYIARVSSLQERKSALSDSINLLNSAGCTAFIDMAMDDIAWDALQELRKDHGGKLPVEIAAHWFVKPTGSLDTDLAQVERAIALSQDFTESNSPDFRIVGIKLMCDGVIDACTAALLEPYSSNGSNAPTIWTPESIGPVVKKADEAGLQCALHAIGDSAVKLAIDALSAFGTPGRRHRIEHLEVTSPGDAERLATAGITASVQPAHADPVLLKAWPDLIGPQRMARAFAYREFADAGVNLALGSDAPSAVLDMLRSMYTATTRRSVRDKSWTRTVNDHFALTLGQAVESASYGSAYSCFSEHRVGRLARGMHANFIEVEMQWDEKALLDARVAATWYKGEKVFQA